MFIFGEALGVRRHLGYEVLSEDSFPSRSGEGRR